MTAAMVGASPVTVAEVDAREQQLRSGPLMAALPMPDTSEGRQLRRWLTQLIVTERVVAAQAAALGVTAEDAPAEDELLPDVTARLEIGSIAASALADPLARAVFRSVTAALVVTDEDVAAYHARNPLRFATGERGAVGWRTPVPPPDLEEVRPAITAHLLAAARRRAFRGWLDERSAHLVVLESGYEHPGDPRQPDNTHKH
jgi:[acyl-carrier-protein] S-malonyltransferase